MMERRKYIRVSPHTDIKYKIEGSKDNRLINAKCLNICPEGLCFVLTAPLKKGTRLHIEITTKGNTACTIKGEVLWLKHMDDNIVQREIMAGIKILDMDEKNRKRFLLELCDRMVDKLGDKFPKIKFK